MSRLFSSPAVSNQARHHHSSLLLSTSKQELHRQPIATPPPATLTPPADPSLEKPLSNPTGDLYTPEVQLKLKVGVPVMLLRNVDHSSGLCNGTRLVITRLDNHILEGKVILGSNAGFKVFILKMT
ncbi:hypothetical protein FEM48_Zijuj01G0127600 [Ziziphus jujuba var. spinosa]|uniref:DNA helicase Pif1-like 2B domain-containing protein n=1 Tax=Ziziphus jujuba var. spinosa TaxID=714518 RepID=A0A978W1C3_ZIZJJ|nr:hypothetical protein FEM48_Zijuj01G0127600 [Ziziphus jujuba var. spinosa]